jgi:hypothetical protein
LSSQIETQARIEEKPPWDSHEFRVKTLDTTAAGAGGARLGFSCRNCGRKFAQTPATRRTWAVNDAGLALDDAVTDRWLDENCLRHPGATDDDDRKLLRRMPRA